MNLDVSERLVFSLLLISIVGAKPGGPEINEEKNRRNGKDCAYLNCEAGGLCVHRRFWCKNPPCPRMLYCSKSKRESSRGPSTCDNVRCSGGFVCVVKVRRCHWDEKCEQQIARCVSRREYHEGPATCAGFKCPAGYHCVLRESLCVGPPCKLLRSCARNKDVQTWFGRCRSLGCPSEFECFLRRPGETCTNPPCEHTPDCVTTTENEVTNEYCRGWICPREQRCSVRTTDPCTRDSCEVERSCHGVHGLSINSTRSDEPSSSTGRTSNEEEPDEVNDRRSTKKTLAQMENELIIRELEKRRLERLNELPSSQPPWRTSRYEGWTKEASTEKSPRLWSTHPTPRRVSDPPDSYQDFFYTNNSHPGYILDRQDDEERILVPHRILLPPYSTLEMALVDDYSTKKRPFPGGLRILSPRTLSRQRDVYGRPYYLLPFEGIEELLASDRRLDPRDRGIIPSTERTMDRHYQPEKNTEDDSEENFRGTVASPRTEGKNGIEDLKSFVEENEEKILPLVRTILESMGDYDFSEDEVPSNLENHASTAKSPDTESSMEETHGDARARINQQEKVPRTTRPFHGEEPRISSDARRNGTRDYDYQEQSNYFGYD